MKKLRKIMTAVVALLFVFALFSCSDGAEEEEPEGLQPQTPSVEQPLPSEETETPEQPQSPALPQPEGAEEERVESLNKLAALEEFDFTAVLGDRSAPDWAFGFLLEGDWGWNVTSRLMTKQEEKERFYTELGVSLGGNDLIGMRAAPEHAFGVDLFGGGSLGLGVKAQVPTSESEPFEKTLSASIVHDGDWIVLTKTGGEEERIPLSDVGEYLKGYLNEALTARFTEIVTEIPKALAKGAGLRLAVEDLIDIGFRVEIETEAGLTIRLFAGKALLTNLMNDVLYSFLPEEWIPYLPRTDLGYESTDLDITLSFDENGLFRLYRTESNVKVTATTETPLFYRIETAFSSSGGFSLTASDELPPLPNKDETTEEPEKGAQTETEEDSSAQGGESETSGERDEEEEQGEENGPAK